jgi:hypothetical protein
VQHVVEAFEVDAQREISAVSAVSVVSAVSEDLHCLTKDFVIVDGGGVAALHGVFVQRAPRHSPLGEESGTGIGKGVGAQNPFRTLEWMTSQKNCLESSVSQCAKHVAI